MLLCHADGAESASAPESSSGGFFESLKERFLPEPPQQGSTEGLSETGGAKGETSSSPALTTGTEADFQNGPGGFFESVKETFQPEPAQQPSTEGLSETGGAKGEASAPASLPAGIEADTENGPSGFLETVKERFQPDPAQQTSTEGLSETGRAKEEASTAPALTAGIEADTDKKSDTPAMQSLVAGQCSHMP